MTRVWDKIGLSDDSRHALADDETVPNVSSAGEGKVLRSCKPSPPYTWKSVEVGDSHGSRSVNITADVVAAYWASMPDDVRPSDLTTDPIAIWDQEPVNLIARRFSHGDTVQVNSSWSVAETAGVGDIVEIDTLVIAKRERKAGGRVTTRANAKREGRVLGHIDLEHASVKS